MQFLESVTQQLEEENRDTITPSAVAGRTSVIEIRNKANILTNLSSIHITSRTKS